MSEKLSFSPVETVPSFHAVYTVRVSLIHELIEGDSSFRQVALRPTKIDQTAHVVTSEVVLANVFKLMLVVFTASNL